MRTFLILLILFCSFCSIGFAKESSYYFSKIDGENGLSQNCVKSIIQDSWGFMWFGTQNGLNRYDGKSIKVFNCSDLTSQRSNQNISALYEDSFHKLWVGTDKGIFIFDPLLENFTFFDNKTQKGVQIVDWVSEIVSDKSNNIWIIIPNQGVFKYDQKENKLSHYLICNSDNATKNNPECVCVDHDGKVWIGTNGAGIYLYNPAKNTFIQYLGDRNGSSLKNENIFAMCDYGEELVVAIHEGQLKKFNKKSNTLNVVNAQGVHYKIIRDVACMDNNELWVATQAGLYIINEALHTEKHIQEEPMHPYSLSDRNVSVLYKDCENGIWIGSNFGGANYLPNRGIEFDKYVPLFKGNSLSSKRIRELKEDNRGNIWIGTQDAGLNVFNPHTKEFKQINKQLFNPNTLALLVDNNKLWVGFFKNGFDIIDLSNYRPTHYHAMQLGLNEESVNSIYKDSKGQIWLGNAWGVFVSSASSMKFKRMDNFGASYIFDIMEDSKKRIWVATMGNGVFCYSPETNKTKHFQNNSKAATSLSSNSVSSITEDSKGSIWFSTDRGGICKYEEHSSNFTTITIKDGLPDNVTYKILEDKNKNLWFGTNKGLVKLNPETKKVRVFTNKDGLLGNQFNYKSAIKSTTGIFYFGGIDGLIAFNPDQIEENNFSPPVYITKLTIFNNEVGIGGKDSPLKNSIIHTKRISLGYNQSNIGFDFAALSFVAPLANKYAYKMVNVDKDWIYTTNNHSASYTQLRPGKYTFMVKGSNNDGHWNEKAATLEITILPPWWQSTIAEFLYIILTSIFIYYLLLIYKRRLIKKAEEQQTIFEIKKEKELYRTKVDFFTDIAHEIRTPLTLITGPLESMLEKNITDKEISKDLYVMERNTNRLMNLINQLLDFRKVDADKFILKFKKISINNFIEEMIFEFQAVAINKKKDIKLFLPDNPIIAAVDKEGLTKITSNLLLNAIKYSDSNIEVILSQEYESFVLRITNDGALIPLEDEQHVFEPFYQVNRSDSLTGSSSGIGLTLARSLAELHRGTISLETSNSLNSFVLKLPLYQEINADSTSEAEYLIDEIEGETKQEKSNYTVLIVEDNSELLAFIADKLQEAFEVEKANNGIEALEILELRHVDIIVSDVMMPLMDGLELCRKVKSNIEFSHIPIVLLTVKNDMETKIKGLEIGAEAYLEKPFSFNFLISQLTTLLNNREKEREAFSRKPVFHVHNLKINKSDEQFMNKIIDVIVENITEVDFNVERMADILCMSRSSLHRKIKALTTLPPVDFIRLIKLKKAAEIIQEGNYRMSEICYLVGINSPSYFSKLFLKQFGITPTEFSKQSLGKE